MAVYKPSNFSPNLQEIDITQPNTFSCQVNTNGDSVKAYDLSILTLNTGEEIYRTGCTDLSTPVRNKNFLNIPNISSTLSSKLVNGKDYQWGIRTYVAPKGSTAQPLTPVCSGFLVGSTKYLIWTKNNEKLKYDWYIEVETTGPSQIMDILEPNEDNLTKPNNGVKYTERRKIDWVEKDLGFNKDYSKIECTEKFTYNYVNGTPFKIYQCSDKHDYIRVYVDPNDEIDSAYYIVIYENQADATAAHNAGETPGTASPTITPRETGRKIIGYSSDTGEIRVEEPFKQVPVNGNAYLLFERDRTNDTYKEITSDVSQLIGGSPITDETFKIITNCWDSSLKQLFIQPNINIKSDDTNPNEIVFDSNGSRLDIIKTTSTTLIPGKTVDITMEKLDNTQWLLHYLSVENGINPPIIPKSTYTVYTDFMDSTPNSIVYARQTPSLTVQYKNTNSSEDEVSGQYTNIDTIVRGWRDISFRTIWTSANNTQIKYYQYILYDKYMTEITRSAELYDSDLTWSFRGFESGGSETVGNKYYIRIIIIDNYDKEFSQISGFNIYYETEQGIVPIGVDLVCDEQAFNITAISPSYVETTNKDGVQTVTGDNVNGGMLSIPSDRVLNYTTVIGRNAPIIISPTFYYLTQFQLTSDFIGSIPSGKDKTVLEIAHKNSSGTYDKFTLKMNSISSYYFSENSSGVHYHENTEKFKMKLYKNDSSTALSCFNGSDYFDVKSNDPSQEFMFTDKLTYALQDNTDNIYHFINSTADIPSALVIGHIYVYSFDLQLGNTVLFAGVYRAIGDNPYLKGNYKSLGDTSYIFISNLSSLPSGTTYDSVQAPANTRGKNGELLFTEANNVWVDSKDFAERLNKSYFNHKWFILYLTVDNTSGTEVVNCTIEISDERI